MSISDTIKKTFRSLLRPLDALLLTIGLDLRKLPNIQHLPAYIAQYRDFKKRGGSISHTYPVLSDYKDYAGTASGHYFHQDLLVASLIHQANPERHIDIGSRIDGFVAHVASFRKIEVIDIRAMRDIGHENISFLQADLMDQNKVRECITDSLSCLHAIEHFGLGRYGDRLDPDGHIKGFNNLLKMLCDNGTLYISFPIGKKNEIHFNAHRVFYPTAILSWPAPSHELVLRRFDYVDDNGSLHQNVNLTVTDIDTVFGCGIYTFQKIS